ncbi:MAG TPA: hypothetical protein VGH28_09990 [Polyangiaceae bacterium]
MPEPVGTLRISSFFRVGGGKIVWYETYFDPTALNTLLANAKRGKTSPFEA